MSTTAEIQAYVRANTATAYSYEGDLHALCDLAGVPAGHLLERLGALLETLPQGVLALLQNGSVEELLPIPAPLSPASLFASGEQGLWYDISDFSTLFQDAAGTIPVTAVEQPVGLILDKSKGLELGPERTKPIPIGPASVVSDNGVLTVTTLSNTSGAGLFLATLALGKWYKVRYRARVLDVGTVCTVQGAVSHPQLPTDGSFATFDGLALGNGGYIYFIMPDGQINKRVEVSEYSVRELPGNHASQATTTARGILRQDANGAYYIDLDGTDDNYVTGSIDFTATDKMTIWAGIRKLDDTTRILCELSENANSNQGTFGVTSGLNAQYGRYSTICAGSRLDALASNISYFQSSLYPAPDSAVITATHDIAGDLSRIRHNGSSAGAIDGTGDKGTGNFGNYPLYLFSRAGVFFRFKGQFYGLIIRGAATDTAQLEQTEQWINSKMGGIY